MKITITIEDNGKTTHRNFRKVPKAIEHLESLLPASVTFYHIGGYECLRDGTREDGTFTSIKEVQEFLDEYGIEYPTDIEDFYEFIEAITPAWEEHYDDGGGSGWIEIN